MRLERCLNPGPLAASKFKTYVTRHPVVRLSARECFVFWFSLGRADEAKLVIVDNDFTGPPDTLSDLRSALMFLENSHVKVLGFTVVTEMAGETKK